MNTRMLCVCVVALGVVGVTPTDGLAGEPFLTHTEHVTSPQASFTLTVPGSVDQRRMGGWTTDPTARYNPTRQLTIRNVGDQPVVNPHITVDGGPSWFDIDHIVEEFAKPGMSDEEKSFALWQWCRHNISAGPTFRGPIWGETRSMTRFMNAFGTGACGTYHIVMPVIGAQAGLDTFSGCFASCAHAVQYEFYDGQPHYFDAHIPHGPNQPRGWFALELNNTEIAGVDDIMADRYLIDRAGSGPERFSYVAYFGPGCSFNRMKLARRDPHHMNLTLRPQESITWFWDIEAPTWQEDSEPTRQAGKHVTGRLEFVPRLTASARAQECTAISNVRSVTQDARTYLTADDPSRTSELFYRMRCPYPITQASMSADVEIAPGGRASLAYSFDGRDFIEIRSSGKVGRQWVDAAAPADKRLRQPTFTHELWFQISFNGKGTKLHRLAMREDFQVYRPSLPSLHAGRNAVRYEHVVDPLENAADLGLVNPGFEQNPTAGQTPAGWTPFGQTDGTCVGQWLAGNRPRQGNAMFGVAAHYETKNGGIYQKIKWQGGRHAQAAVYILTQGDSTHSSGCTIGLDPTGGTNPKATSVVWSDPARSNTWKRIETPVVEVPANNELTVFLAHKHAQDGQQFNVTAFDACTLEDPDTAANEKTQVNRQVDITYTFRPMPNQPVPQPPAKPVHPANGKRFGFNETMRWSPAPIKDNLGIDNYEIYISSRKDLAWPVMPNTHHVIRSCKPAFALVFPDVLRHGATYYWRVRGRSSDGVWGVWSDTWSFVAAGPNPPTHLNARCDNNEAVLTWNPPTGGTAIDHYEVYGSGEPGFSPMRADEEALVSKTVVHRPANLLGTTPTTQWDCTRLTACFYRVIAVDGDGNRSAPTPITKLPTPALLPTQLPSAVVGKAYHAKIPARYRTGRYAWALREGLITDLADAPRYALSNNSGADWLTIDPATGHLAGTPHKPGKGSITVDVQTEKNQRAQQTYRLSVVEK